MRVAIRSRLPARRPGHDAGRSPDQLLLTPHPRSRATPLRCESWCERVEEPEPVHVRWANGDRSADPCEWRSSRCCRLRLSSDHLKLWSSSTSRRVVLCSVAATEQMVRHANTISTNPTNTTTKWRGLSKLLGK